MVVNKVPAKARRCGDFGSVTVTAQFRAELATPETKITIGVEESP
jgi:hypothetical protein